MGFGPGDLLQSLQQGVIALNNMAQVISAAQAAQTQGLITTPSPTVTFNTRTVAAATSITTSVQAITTGGYSTAGDGGSALYTKVGGSTTGGFQSADGAWWALAERVIDPRMLGAVCDGSDRTTEFQNAVDVAGANGGAVAIPNTLATGGLAFSGTITISSPITIYGVGIQNSRILGIGGAAQNLFIVATNTSVHFKDLWIDCSTTNKTAGAGIIFDGSGVTPEADFCSVERCNFTNHLVALDFEFAAYYTVRDCLFQNFSNVGSNQIVVRNGASGDAGDSQIVGCWFFGGFTNTTYINWQSSGGLRIARNKFLGNGTAGVMININAQGTTGTGLLSIVDNSFDNPKTVGLSITTASSVEFITNCSINNNRFDGGAATLGFVYVQKTAGSTIGALNISGNNFTDATNAIIVPLADTVLINSNIFGGITAAVNITTVGAAIVDGNLLGGGTLTPAATTGTVTVGTNK